MFTLNAWAIDAIVRKLNEKLNGSQLISCFSSSKDDWFLNTSRGAIQIKFYRRIPFILFPETSNLPVRNRLLFIKPENQISVERIWSIEGDRSFCIKLGQFTLLFNFFGIRSDIILFDGGTGMRSFRAQNSLSEFPESEMGPANYENEMVSATDFDSLKKQFRSFPDILEEQASARRYFNGFSKAFISLYLKEEFAKPWYFHPDSPPYLDFKGEEDAIRFDNPLEAVHHFSIHYLRYIRFEDRRKEALHAEFEKIKRLEQKIQSFETHLNKVLSQTAFSQKGDILMANLHNMEKGLDQIRLFNFYNNKEEVISLKPDLNPQQNAARYYRKGKQQHIEIEFIQKSLEEHKKLLAEANERVEKWQNQHMDERFSQPEIQQNATLQSKRKTFIIEEEGFEIWVGRNASDNDELLRKAHKNDLWLHARSIKGAHVIVRCGQRGTPPESVVERAARLAAYNSEARGSEWVPVVVTERKYVRKRKGAAAGEVVVDREDTIMAQPSLD